MLYPLKFKPIFKERIWGGSKLNDFCQNPEPTNKPIGECWALSALRGDESVVVNGPLAGKTLNQLLVEYREELVGEDVFKKYQYNFPLLFKFIDANDKLSIQVHPNDELAMQRHGCFGKSEMWYIIDAEEGAELILGFNQEVDKDLYLKHLNEGTLETILNKVKVRPGDAFYIPAGLVHAIGKGILLAEIQQSSDITYRLYDYNRVDANGEKRQLHTEEALGAVGFNDNFKYIQAYSVSNISEKVLIVENEFFAVNVFDTQESIVRPYPAFSSFVVYICLFGDLEIKYEDIIIGLKKGEAILIPSCLKKYYFSCVVESKVLEIFLNF